MSTKLRDTIACNVRRLIVGLSIEELTSKRLEKVIACYAQSSNGSRENITRIAENEMRYSLEYTDQKTA